MHFGKMYFVTYWKSPTCFGCTCDSHLGVSKILINYTINCWLAQVKPLAFTVNIVGTPCCNTVLVYILLKQMKFKLLLEIGKTGRGCVECSSYALCWI